MKNGQEIGRTYLEALDTYLNNGAALPVSRGNILNVTELSRITGIPKSTFYQNPAVKARVEQACAAQDLLRWGESPEKAVEVADDTADKVENGDESDLRNIQLLKRKLHKLEQQNAALVAENCELRNQVKTLRQQMGREDMMIETGRRIVPPGGSE
jgi:hypothetical protein